MSVTTIEGVRHGDTFRSEKKITIQGGGLDDDEAQLSAKGIAEATRLGDILAEKYAKEIQDNAIVIIASPLGRCLNTAKSIDSAFLKKKEELYTNNLKNREFDKKAPQNFCQERVTIAERQGTSEDKNFEVKPTQSKTDSSSCLCITGKTAESYLVEPIEDLEEIRHGKFENMRKDERDRSCIKWYEAQEEKYKEQGIVPPQDWRWEINPLTQKKHGTEEPLISSEKMPELAVEKLKDRDPERINDVRKRGERVFHEICDRYPNKKIIVVTSGVFLWALATSLKARQENDTTPFPTYFDKNLGEAYPKTCSISHFERDEKGMFYYRGMENPTELPAQKV